MEADNSDKKPDKESKPIIIRNTTDLQRIKLEKLMQNPDKPVMIPEKPKERGMPVVPDFVRNVMGSSAGAGSGEFHVYRHLRRKEYARQKYLKERGEREKLDSEYHEKLDEYKKLSAEKTAKKRLKRLRRKKKHSKAKKQKIDGKSSQSDGTTSESQPESGDEAKETTSTINENEEEPKEEQKADDQDGPKNPVEDSEEDDTNSGKQKENCYD